MEDHFAAAGPHGVVHEDVVDSFGDTPYELFAPKDLGAPGERHPIIAWGNGTIAHPVEYTGILSHLASWGFVVIASTSDQTGTGEEILASIHRAIRMGDEPTSRLYHHVDADRIGVAGHSQGAGGSVRAATSPDNPIDTVITVELPNKLFTIPPDTKAHDESRLRVPVLFFGGSDDGFISSPETNRAFYDSVPGSAAMAVLTGADHNVIQHSAGRFPGYLTAWMRYQLVDDAFAAGAFTGPHPELLTAPGWTNQALKGLAAPQAATVAPSGPPQELPITGGTPALAVPLSLVVVALVLRPRGRAARRG